MLRSLCVTGIALLVLAGCARDQDALMRGTVEVREVDVASLAAGRVASVLVDEGEAVRIGDTLAIVTAPNLAPDLAIAESRLQSLRAVLRDLEAGSEPQVIAGAAAEVAAAEAEAARLVRDRDRLQALLEAGAVAPRDAEAGVTAATMALARVDAARERLALVRAGTRRDRLAAARADVMQAEAAVEARTAGNAEYVLIAPMDGVVLARLREAGDMVGATGGVVRLGDISAPWVRVFVPARVLSGLAVGDSAAIYPPGAGGAVDGSQTDRRTAGRIVAINPRAEFVTRAALTDEEQADLLFGVKVAIADTTQRFKPGMPASVRLYPRADTP